MDEIFLSVIVVQIENRAMDFQYSKSRMEEKLASVNGNLNRWKSN